jgi:hypothetical protein
VLFTQSGHPGTLNQCPLLGAKRTSGWRALSIISVLSASRDRADERAGDPLHSGRVKAKAFGNPAYTFTGALTLVQGGPDSLLKARRELPPQLLTLISQLDGTLAY